MDPRTWPLVFFAPPAEQQDAYVTQSLARAARLLLSDLQPSQEDPQASQLQNFSSKQPSPALSRVTTVVFVLLLESLPLWPS